MSVRYVAAPRTVREFFLMKTNPVPCPSSPADLDRVVVVGTSCSGKSTFAGKLAARLECPHIELDLLHWQADWIERPTAEFRGSVAQAVAAPRWVVDGNYSLVRDIVWGRATTVIWLNYSLRVVGWRSLRRAVRRIVTREFIHNGNRETNRKTFFSRDSILLWVLQTYHRRRREYPQLFATPQHAHLTFLVFEHPRDAERFLGDLPCAANPTMA
jgi:adenylate kinase family enzyme